MDDCRNAIDAGAQFIVSPVRVEEVMQNAIPASVHCPTFIKDVKGPLVHIDIMTTGGITLETAIIYLDAGAKVVRVGSAVIHKDLVENGNCTRFTE